MVNLFPRVHLSRCPMCRQAKKLLDSLGAQYQVWEIDGLPEESQIQDEFAQISGARTVPRLAFPCKCNATLPPVKLLCR